MRPLIPIEQLTSHEKNKAEQVAERERQFGTMQAQHDNVEYAAAQTPVVEKKFVYHARTPEQWESRAQQGKRYLRKQVKNGPKTKAEILAEVVREFPDATVAELAEASGMSQSWIQKTLKAAGITLAKLVQQRETQP